MPAFAPMFAPSATRVAEYTAILTDPPRPSVPPEIPVIARPGVARYGGRGLSFLHAQLAGTPLRCPARAAVRVVQLDPAAMLPVSEVLEISPLPFDLAPVLRRLRGAPTFYMGPFDPIVDDSLVTAGAPVLNSGTDAFVGMLFPDGFQLEPWAWLRIIDDAQLAEDPTDSNAMAWHTMLEALYGAVIRRCLVLDHAGRPLVEPIDPSDTGPRRFTVTLRGGASEPQRTVDLGADSDLEQALAQGTDPPRSLFNPPPGQFIEIAWAGAAPLGDNIPMLAVYESGESTPPGTPLALPAGIGPRITLQALDLARWYPPVEPDTVVTRFWPNCRLDPLVDGIATMRELARDLRAATGSGNGAHLMAWTINRYALDPAVSEDDIVDLLQEIHSSGGIARVLATEFHNLKDPDITVVRAYAVILLALLSFGTITVSSLIPKVHEKLKKEEVPEWLYVYTPALASLLGELLVRPDGIQYILDHVTPKAVSTVQALNEIQPTPPNPIAIFSSNPLKISDNPLAVHFPNLFFGLENDCDQFNVWHNKVQMIKRTPDETTRDGFVAYVGGIDINANRFDSPRHSGRANYHDVHSRVTGPVVRDVFESFRERWEVDRVATGGEPTLLASPPGRPTQPVAGLEVMRVGRTYYGPVDPGNAPLEFAPHGDAGIYKTLLAAMEAARDYIYIEDQYFVPDDGFVTLLAAAQSKCKRLVIVIPSDADQMFHYTRQRWIIRRLREAWGDRVTIGWPQRRPVLRPSTRVSAKGRCWLAKNCGELDTTVTVAPRERVGDPPFWLWIDGEQMLARVKTDVIEGEERACQLQVVRGGTAAFPRWGASQRLHNLGAAVTCSGTSRVFVHAKTMMVDDTFVSIGSANLNRRGFFADGELNVFSIPQELRAAGRNPARDLRVALWAEHLGIPEEMGAILLEDPIAAFDLFRRHHACGNRFTPIEASDIRNELNLSGDMATGLILLQFIFFMMAPLPGIPDPPWIPEDIMRRLWNLAIDNTSQTDPDPKPGPVTS